MAKPAHIRMDLARIQDLVEILLKNQSYLVGPIDILETIADALEASDNPRCAVEVRDLVMDLKGWQLGYAKATKI